MLCVVTLLNAHIVKCSTHDKIFIYIVVPVEVYPTSVANVISEPNASPDKI